MSMAHRGALVSPYRQGARAATITRDSSSSSSRMGAAAGIGVGVSDMSTEPLSLSDPSTCCTYDESSSGAVHSRTRARMTLSYTLSVTLEGLLSSFALRSAWAMASPVAAIMQGSDPASASPSPSPVHRALRSGAALGLGMPFFLLATRFAIFALGRLRGSEAQQPRLGFPLPPGLDENAALDLYVLGLGAAVLGVFVPSLEVLGYLLGRVLLGVSAIWCLFALLVVPPVVCFALGAWFEASSPAEGFRVGTRPTKAMWGFCGAGHVVLVLGCFYSPDVARALGFLLGLVHILRLLQQVFAFPAAAGAGAGMCEDGGVGVAEL